MGLILDSSVLIATERGKFDLEGLFSTLAGESFFMTSITLSEIWHGYHRAKTAVQAERQAYLKWLESIIGVLNFTPKEAFVHAKLWAELEMAGKRIGPHDLIIAATALAQNYSIATLNESEFARVPGLRLQSIKRYARV